MHQVRGDGRASGTAWTARRAVRGVPSEGLRRRGLPALRQEPAGEPQRPEGLLLAPLREYGVGPDESRRRSSPAQDSGSYGSVTVTVTDRRAALGRGERDRVVCLPCRPPQRILV